MFKVNLIAINIKDEDKQTPPVEVLVDTGAELSCLPTKLLLEAGIFPRGKKYFATATNQLFERDYGYAILKAEGYTTNDEIIFGLDTDELLLGVRTIEGFSVMIDNVNHRFVPTPSLAVSMYKLKGEKLT